MAITQQQAIASQVIQQILGNRNTVVSKNLGAKHKTKLVQSVDKHGVYRFKEVRVK